MLLLRAALATVLTRGVPLRKHIRAWQTLLLCLSWWEDAVSFRQQRAVYIWLLWGFHGVQATPFFNSRACAVSSR